MGDTIGNLLSICRELKGMSLRDVAKRTGLSNPAISQYETGKCEPSFRAAVMLCDCYGIKLDRLASSIREEEMLKVLR